jgi:hypothetical protein
MDEASVSMLEPCEAGDTLQWSRIVHGETLNVLQAPDAGNYLQHDIVQQYHQRATAMRKEYMGSVFARLYRAFSGALSAVGEGLWALIAAQRSHGRYEKRDRLFIS